MIAIFSSRRNNLMITAGTYKYITREEQVFGTNFTSVILTGNWYECKEKVKAYEMLEKRQPELFKI
jgi:hypothetical protein